MINVSLLHAGSPPDSVLMLEEILHECTSFEFAGAMSKQATEEAVAEVAQDVVEDEDLPLVINAPPEQPGQPRTHSDRIMSGIS